MRTLLAAALLLAGSGALAQQAPVGQRVDPALADFVRTEPLTGTIRSVGSSTLTNLLYRWSVEYRRVQPAIEFQVTSGGSDVAVPALVEGRTDLGPMSRPMNAGEVERFRAKFGYPPTRITVAVDALAVYVNKNNPIRQLSLAQLERVFGAAPRAGGRPALTWGELGLTGEWEKRPLVVKGPSPTQGFHSVFRGAVLGGGEYRFEMRPEPVASSVVQAVGAEDNAVGFASEFYSTARTRALALSKGNGGPYYPPTVANALDGNYPLARRLFIYVNRAPGTRLPPQVTDFLKFACSEQGQDVAARDGNYPLDAALAARECLAAIES